MKRFRFVRTLVIVATMAFLGTALFFCTKNPEAPVRDNPFAGDPFGLLVELDSSGVILSWNALDVSGLTGYKIYRSLDSAVVNDSLSTTSAGVRTYTDRDFYADSTYHYKVTGLIGSNESGASEVESVTITATLCVLPDNWPAPDTAATSPTIAVTNCDNPGNFAWTITDNADWITTSVAGGDVPGTFTIAVDSNKTGGPRTGHVVVSSSVAANSPDTVVVSQGSLGAALCVSPPSWSPASDGDSMVIDITNCGNDVPLNWTATEDADWLLLSSLNGTSPGSFTITAEANLTGFAREDTATITAPDVSGSPSVIVVIQPAQSLFSSDTRYPAGDGPEAVIAFDFDGDGDEDLAVCLNEANMIAVFMNEGDGRFQSAVTYEVGVYPNSVVAADLDGDSDIDLVSPNWGTNDISILLNSGDGTFLSAVNFGAGSYPISACVVDVDIDGDQDIVATNYSSDSVTILLNDGDGTFQTGASFPTASSPRSISAADLDGDDDFDLVTSNTGAGNISILLGDGNGGFQPAGTFSTGVSPWSTCLVDLSGNGVIDVVAANAGSRNISVLFGNGDGSFQPAIDYEVDTGPYSVIAADLDSDGDYDLATANSGSDNISVLLNNGDGTLRPAVSSGAGDYPYSVIAADFDGDGDNDLCVANFVGDNISILLNRTVTK